MKSFPKTLLVPVLIFIITQSLVWAWLHVVDQELPNNPEAISSIPETIPRAVRPAYRWDSAYYYDVATKGYDYAPRTQHSAAFFPLYPSLLAAAAKLGLEPVCCGIVLNGLALLLSYWLLYKLTLVELEDHSAARRSVLLLAVFPTAYYFNLLYTESLFLLLSLGGFYFARTRQWRYAAALGLLATATRPTGIVLWGALVLEWMNQQDWSLLGAFKAQSWRNLWNGVKKSPTELLCLILVPLGLISYMIYLHHSFDDAQAFLGAQEAWGREYRSPITEISRSLEHSFAMLFNEERYNYSVPTNSVAALVWMIAIPFIWRNLGPSYGAYCLVSLLVPISTGLMSLSRFLLVLFPLQMVLAKASQPKAVELPLVLISSILLLGLSSEFLRWYFIA